METNKTTNKSNQPPQANTHILSELEFFTFNDPALDRLYYEVNNYGSLFTVDKTPSHWLTILGNPGVGKTMLTKELYHVIRDNFLYFNVPAGKGSDDCEIYMQRRRYIEYINVRQIAEELKSNFDRESIKAARRAWFTVIDDLGVGHDPNGWIMDELEAILDKRLGKPTVITSNLTFDQIHEKNARLASRLVRDQNRVITVWTKDYCTRRKGKQ
jgi:DNA replication protein DnaC